MKSCIPYSEYNPDIHEIVSGHDTLEECLLSCDCASSSSSEGPLEPLGLQWKIQRHQWDDQSRLFWRFRPTVQE